MMAQRGIRKTRVGTVVSAAMKKSVVVATTTLVRHPLYKRVVTRTAKFMAHDEQDACGVGDRVRIVETRPISKRKRWRVVEIIEKAK
jgi:small subunit ribosomal protein S17